MDRSNLLKMIAEDAGISPEQAPRALRSALDGYRYLADGTPAETGATPTPPHGPGELAAFVAESAKISLPAARKVVASVSGRLETIGRLALLGP